MNTNTKKYPRYFIYTDELFTSFYLYCYIEKAGGDIIDVRKDGKKAPGFVSEKQFDDNPEKWVFKEVEAQELALMI